VKEFVDVETLSGWTRKQYRIFVQAMLDFGWPPDALLLRGVMGTVLIEPLRDSTSAILDIARERMAVGTINHQ
jgi:hypothetical protein